VISHFRRNRMTPAEKAFPTFSQLAAQSNFLSKARPRAELGETPILRLIVRPKPVSVRSLGIVGGLWET
jgi:hypothetical protein